MRILALIMLVFMLSACQIIGGNDDGNESNTGDQEPVIIDWDRSPTAIVFRAEVTGGENSDAFFMRNEVPLCTVYGDNRVVWVVNTEGGTQVLFDTLTDARIRSFVQELAVREEIYSTQARADLQLPEVNEPVVEKLTLAVNDVVHVTDSFADWDTEYFQQIVQICQGLSEAPTIFEPRSAWISATQVEYDPGSPVVAWDTIGSGLDFAQLATAGERRWVTNERLVRVLWNLIRDSPPDLQFAQAEGTFQVAVEAPNVNPSAPPAPAG